MQMPENGVVPPPSADSAPTDPGRVLALDLGEKRIGVAISDPTRLVARRLALFNRRSRQEDAAEIGRLIAQHHATLLIIGLPTRLDGSDSPQTAWVRDYSAALAAILPVPVLFQEETLTTTEARANRAALTSRRNSRRQHAPVDDLAAAFILQRWLDNNQGAGNR
jgi:putative Holliday junction resolvase